VERTGSTVPRRQLGRHLRDLRHQAGITIKAGAKKFEWSEAKMWRIETGQTSLRSIDARVMCETYGASAELTEALMGLAKETKAKGWWHAYGDVIPEGFDVYIGLEESASQLSMYQSHLVPGVLQTEDYARAIITEDKQDKEGAEEIDRRVNLRIARQRLLTRPIEPPTLRVVLDEGVLRRTIGGNAVMAGQLRHLKEASEFPNVHIRVVPFDAGVHPGVMSGPFVILRFPANGEGHDSEPPTVYADGYTGDLYLDKPHEVERYDMAFERIWMKALNEQASRRLITEVEASHEQG
jgi:hypothetical protein